MKFQVVSDLHLDSNEYDDYEQFIKPVSDILILNGDIGSLYKLDQLETFLSIVCPKYKLVIYVFGNHEFYRYSTERKTIGDLKKGAKNISTRISNLKFLDRQSIIIDDVCIIGCTLWSGLGKNNILPKFIVKIQDMTPTMYNRLHMNDLKYINMMISHCKTKNLKVIVVTHYPPTHMLKNKSRGKYDYLYTNSLDYLLKKDLVHTWVYGHIHSNFDYISKGGTRVVGNQLGRRRDKVSDFSKTKCISID